MKHSCCECSIYESSPCTGIEIVHDGNHRLQRFFGGGQRRVQQRLPSNCTGQRDRSEVDHQCNKIDEWG